MTSRIVPNPSASALPDRRAHDDAPRHFPQAARGQAEAPKTAVRWQGEHLAFLARRGGKTLKLLDDLTDDDKFGDVFDIACTYMQNAAMDRAAESPAEDVAACAVAA